MSSMAQVHGLEAVVPDFVMKIVGVTHDLGKLTCCSRITLMGEVTA